MWKVLLCVVWMSTNVHSATDEANTPVDHAQAIADSPFIFIGRMTVDETIFLRSDGTRVPDPKGELTTAYNADKFRATEVLPTLVMPCVTMKPSVVLRGDVDLYSRFLSLSWMDATFSTCPHHAMALASDEERIWVLMVDADKRTWDYVSLPMKHVAEVEESILKEQ